MTTVFDTCRFIREVEARVCLWDSSHEDYSNKTIKHRCWIEIFRIFYDDFDKLSLKKQKEIRIDLLRKWKSLRNSFTRELKKRMKDQSGSCDDRRKTYVFFQNLLFLSSTVTLKSAANTLTDVEVGELIIGNNRSDKRRFSDDGPEIQHVPARLKHPLNNAKRTKTSRRIEESTQKKLSDVGIKNTERKQVVDGSVADDEDRLFLLSLVTELRKVPEHLKLDVKSDILHAIKKGQSAQQLPPSSEHAHLPSECTVRSSIQGGCNNCSWNLGPGSSSVSSQPSSNPSIHYQEVYKPSPVSSPVFDPESDSQGSSDFDPLTINDNLFS